jgi:predicted RNA-binding Zn-ribbon protein involved in translation (DUF1610 family)
MPHSLIWMLLIIAVFLVSILLKKNKKGLPKSYPYKSVNALLTRAERSFLGVLDGVAGSDYRIFSKVRLADIVQVKNGLSRSDRQSALNRINRKHIDFILCNPADLSILCAVELDDRSHDRISRKERDLFVDKALDAAGIPILHVTAQAGYTPAKLSSALSAAMGIETVESAPVAIDPKGSDEYSEPALQESAGHSVCPKCGAPLVMRKAKKGRHSGEKFWGCSNFPKCRFVLKQEEFSAETESMAKLE